MPVKVPFQPCLPVVHGIVCSRAITAGQAGKKAETRRPERDDVWRMPDAWRRVCFPACQEGVILSGEMQAANGPVFLPRKADTGFRDRFAESRDLFNQSGKRQQARLLQSFPMCCVRKPQCRVLFLPDTGHSGRISRTASLPSGVSFQASRRQPRPEHTLPFANRLTGKDCCIRIVRFQKPSRKKSVFPPKEALHK